MELFFLRMKLIWNFVKVMGFTIFMFEENVQKNIISVDASNLMFVHFVFLQGLNGKSTARRVKKFVKVREFTFVF